MSESGKTVIITGGIKGLGRELSLQFARTGARIVAVYNNDSLTAEKFEKEAKASGFDMKTLKLDITSGEVESALMNLDQIKSAASITLVLNAWPSFNPEPFHLSEWESFDRQMNVAVKGAYFCVKPLLRTMIRQKNGTVISVLSSALEESGSGSLPVKGFSAYTTAKSALKGFTRALASEYRAKGIRFFTVSPGTMDTELTRNWNEAFKSQTVETDKIARLIVELEKSDSIPANGEDYRF